VQCKNRECYYPSARTENKCLVLLTGAIFCSSATGVTHASGHRPSHASFRCPQPRHQYGRRCVDEVAHLEDCSCRQLRSICRSVSRSVLQSVVLQQLDYGNATLAGIPSHLIKQMQSVMNSAARLVFSALRYDRFTPLLTQLHWLKVPECIKFKLAVLVYKCLQQTALPYLAEELHQSSAESLFFGRSLHFFTGSHRFFAGSRRFSLEVATFRRKSPLFRRKPPLFIGSPRFFSEVAVSRSFHCSLLFSLCVSVSHISSLFLAVCCCFRL